MEHTFALFADFHQFVLRDAQADWADLADRWTPEAVEAMVVQGRGYVAIGTARGAVVPVIVGVGSSEPKVADGDRSRIVHGWLPLPSGELVVSGVTDNERSGGRIAVPPGNYNMRVRFEALDPVSSDGLSGDDRYVVDLWPAT